MAFCKEKVILLAIYWTLCLIQHAACSKCPTRCFCYENNTSCSGLKTFPTSFPAEVRFLILDNIEIENIPEDAFKGLAAIENIDIKSSKIERLDRFSFRNLENLSKVSFTYCTIGDIASYAFYNMRNVSLLSLSFSSVENIQSYAFNKLQYVQTIEWSNLLVTKVESFAFENLEKIDLFSIHDSNISSVATNALHDWHGIKTFAMAYNHFTTFKCGNVEAAIAASNLTAFHNNYFQCHCDLVWVQRYRDILINYLTSNRCNKSDKDTVIFTSVTPEILGCTEDEFSCDRSDRLSTNAPKLNNVNNSTGITTSSSGSYSTHMLPDSSSVKGTTLGNTKHPMVSPLTTSVHSAIVSVTMATIHDNANDTDDVSTTGSRPNTHDKLQTIVTVTSDISTEITHIKKYNSTTPNDQIYTSAIATDGTGSDVNKNGGNSQKNRVTKVASSYSLISLLFVAILVAGK